jgi:hypothetical protein
MVLFIYTPVKIVSENFQQFLCLVNFLVCGMLIVKLFLVAAKERLYPVADATTFFTDMHYILRVLAAGDIRTVCHHRLNLLEQVMFTI